MLTNKQKEEKNDLIVSSWFRISTGSGSGWTQHLNKCLKIVFLVLNELVAAGGGGGVLLGEHVLGEHVCATLLALATTTFIQG